MRLDTFVRFDARPGKLVQLRDELVLLLEPTRAESGCLDIGLYEETNGSGTLLFIPPGPTKQHSMRTHSYRT